MKLKGREEHSGSILFVDDDLASLRLLTDLFTEQGLTVHGASGGALALGFVRTTLPDLILLDIKMPEINGYHVCRSLKTSERTRDIPVIFLTALTETTDKVRGFQEGAVDFLTKPLQVEEALARVKTHVALRVLQKQRLAQTARLQREIDERQRAEAARRESEKRYRTFIANSSVGICEEPVTR